MNRRYKCVHRVWFVCCVTVFLVFALAACALKLDNQGASSAVDGQTQEIVFVDQAGQKVTVQTPVKRIVCMQHHSVDMLVQLGAADRIVAVEKNWKTDLGSYIERVFPGIASLPTPGDLTELNVEEIAALHPDIVLVASQANPDEVAKLRELRIPVATISLRAEGKQEEAQNPRLSNADKAYTDGCEWAIKTLGMLVGAEERANRIWSFAMDSRAYVEQQIGTMNDADRKRVFVANPGNKTYGNDKYVGCQLLRAGGINVAAADIQGFKPYNMEQLAKWDPQMILVQDRYPEVYQDICQNPVYAQLDAVRNHRVILAPYWSKPWGNPDTDSIALGEPWLAHQLYPQKVSASYVKERAQQFYQEFYGVDFIEPVD